MSGALIQESGHEMLRQLRSFLEVMRPEKRAVQEALLPLYNRLQRAVQNNDVFVSEMMAALDAHLAHDPDQFDDCVRQTAARFAQQLDQAGSLEMPIMAIGRQDNTLVSHAMFLSIQKEHAADSFRVRLYNTGEGIQHHEQQSDIENKHHRVSTVFEVVNIEQSKLQASIFFQPLLAGLWQSNGCVPDNVARLYHHFNRLGTKSAARRFDKEQVVENCSWKVLMAFLKHQVDELTYYSFKLYIQSRVLWQAIEESTTTPWEEEDWSILPLLRPSPERVQNRSHALPLIQSEVFAEAHAKFERTFARVQSLMDAKKDSSIALETLLRTASQSIRQQMAQLPQRVRSFVARDRAGRSHMPRYSTRPPLPFPPTFF